MVLLDPQPKIIQRVVKGTENPRPSTDAKPTSGRVHSSVQQPRKKQTAGKIRTLREKLPQVTQEGEPELKPGDSNSAILSNNLFIY